MSVGSHPAITPRSGAARFTMPLQRVVERVGVAARGSLMLRALLVSGIAFSVTGAGVAAGALVVAPVVARASSEGTASAVSTSLSDAGSSMVSAARRAWSRLDVLTGNLLETLPEPVARYLLPSIAILSLTIAVLALLLPSRSARNAVGGGSYGASPGGLRMPRSVPSLNVRTSAHKQRTPKAVEAMAASGDSTSDIAWKTGLPIDAVRLLLAISSGPRQVHSRTA